MMTALFFGSFNPIHVGHLIIAESVLLEKEIKEVWFVVSPQNPFKKAEGLLPEQNRYYLAQLATEDNPRFKVSNVEFSLPKPSYTIDTLNYLEEKYPKRKFCLLMGGDNLTHFHKWKNHEQILENYPIYVYKRPYEGSANIASSNIHFLDVPQLDISATLIRERIQSKQSVRYLLTESVEQEIKKAGYYKKN